MHLFQNQKPDITILLSGLLTPQNSTYANDLVYNIIYANKNLVKEQSSS